MWFELALSAFLSILAPNVFLGPFLGAVSVQNHLITARHPLGWSNLKLEAVAEVPAPPLKSNSQVLRSFRPCKKKVPKVLFLKDMVVCQGYTQHSYILGSLSILLKIIPVAPPVIQMISEGS